MSNVLNKEKKQQVIALGKLGWTLRRIEQTTGVRRETISTYLKAAGIAIPFPQRDLHVVSVDPAAARALKDPTSR